MYYDMTHDNKIIISLAKQENEHKVKILSRRRIEPMSTDTHCVSGVENMKSPTTLRVTPRPRHFIVNGEL